MHYEEGSRVRVMIPLREQSNAGAVREFQNKIAVVNKVEYHYSGKCSFGYTYELEGCVSDYGTPYTFPEDWLVPFSEEVAE